MQAALTRLLGAGAAFRSAQQQEALEEIEKGTSPLVVVLPTGGGKSLLFQLPAALPGAGTTIVVLPFRALTTDLIKRCREMGLSSSTWKGGACETPATRLVFVSAEAAACNHGFLTFAAGLQAQGRLDRIVVDECHVPLTAASYRHQLIHLDRLRAVPCPLVLLTGTLPPVMQPELEELFLLGTAAQGLRYIRASTDRPQFEYRVETCPDAAAAEAYVTALLRYACAAAAGRTRAVLFCRSQADTQRMADRLGCQPYHRASPDNEEAFAAWAGGTAQVIVATSALGTGVDVAGVELAVHLGRPHGIVDYVQEAGRAGRGGVEHARSTVVLTAGELRWLESDAAQERDWNQEALRQYLTERRCRRRRLTAIMDGPERECGEQAGSQRCDLCAARALDTTLDPLTKGVLRHATQAAADQAQRHAVGPQLVRERIQKQGAERQRIEEAVAVIGWDCAACWLRDDGGSPADHALDACETFEQAVGQGYRQIRSQVRFQRGSYSCYRCGLPGDWCGDYSQGQRCGQPDVIVGLAVAAWAARAPRRRPVCVAHVKHLAELIQWLGQPTRVGGSRASQAIQVALEAIQLRAS